MSTTDYTDLCVIHMHQKLFKAAFTLILSSSFKPVQEALVKSTPKSPSICLVHILPEPQTIFWKLQ